MAEFRTEAGGSIDDAVHLFLGPDEVISSENYQVDVAFMEVPNAFNMTIGSGSTALSIMQRYPPNTPFKLRIGPVISFSGRTDGFTRSSAQATEITITGRDAMAYLVDSYIEHDKAFNNTTFDELVHYSIEGAGIKGYNLVYDAAAQRKAVTGQPITVTYEVTVGQLTGAPIDVSQGLNFAVLAKDLVSSVTILKGYRSDKPIQFKAGNTWYSSLKKELDRGGVFLRAGVDPEGLDEFVYLLAAPDGSQPPLYGIINQRGALRNANLVNCFQPKLKNVTTDRHARYVVVGRAGGATTARKRVHGEFIDPEMTSYGYTKPWVKVEETVKSDKHAEYLARKQCAEARRKDRSFSYSFRGHTLPMIKDPARRVVVVPNTSIYLKDDEHGMDGTFWIERVSYKGSSNAGRETEMTLMLPEDLVFGDGDFDRAKKGKKTVMGRKGGAV